MCACSAGACHKLFCVLGSSELHLCICVCVYVLLGMTEWVSRPCQGCGFSPARGRGAQILHYGLIHHPWDSLAPLSFPLSLLPPPSNLVPRSSLLTAAQVPRSASPLPLSPHLLPQCTSVLVTPLSCGQVLLPALLLACFTPCFPFSLFTYLVYASICTLCFFF